MAKNPNERDEQETTSATNTGTTGNTSTTGSTASTSTTDEEDDELEEGDSITVPEEEISLLEEQYANIKQGIEDSYAAQSDAVNKAYGIQETAMGRLIGEAETLRGQKQAQDERALGRERAYRYISGIGDAISGVANLVGATHGASNQTQHYNAPAVIQKAEASRKERKLEMDQLRDRLEELSAQKTALQAARKLKQGELSGAKASELATAELQRVKGMGDIAVANAKNVTDVTRSMVAAAAKGGSGSGQTTTRPARDTSKYVTVYDDDGTAYQFDIQRNPTFEQDYRAAFDAAVTSGSVVLTEQEQADYDSAKTEARKGKPAALDTFFKLHKKRKKVVESMTRRGANDPRWR